MSQILVVTDGAYGHRIEGVVNSFGKKNKFLKMHKIDKPSSMIVDDIEFPKDVLENVITSYSIHYTKLYDVLAC